MCHNSLEFSQDVIENCSDLLNFIQQMILKKVEILSITNDQRSVCFSLEEFIHFLFSKFTSIETVYRKESIKLWEGLVPNLTSKVDFKTFILTNYLPQQGGKPVWSFNILNFETSFDNIGGK